MAFGGGFGGGMGGPIGGGMRTAANPGAGLPFAGIPSEMLAGVRRLLAEEPDHGAPTARFTHQVTEHRPLTLRLLLSGHRRALLVAGFLVVVEALTLQAGPYLTQVAIDDGIVKRKLATLIVAAALFVAAVAITTVASASRVRWTGRIAAWVMTDLRIRVFSHLQRLSLDFYTEEKAGVVMTRMTSDIEVLQQLLQDGLVQFAVQGLTMLVVTIVLFVYDVRLALITIVLIVPPLTGLSLWFRRASERTYLAVRDGIARVLANLSESLHGIRIVTAFNRQSYNYVQHRNVVGSYRDANNASGEVNSRYGPATDGLGIIGQVVLLFIGGHMVLHHQLTVGELTAFVLYLNSFFLPIQQLVQLYTTYQQGQAAVTKLRDLLATQPSVREAPAPVELPPIVGAIDFDDVSFGYLADRPVIEHINLRIAAGETVALVGPTGAGKSTLAKLVTRFYDPTAGRILIDGCDLTEVSLHSLRRQLGVVPQEPFLFAGSLRDNVAFARPEAGDEEVLEALRLVGLTDLVERHPEGLDAPVQERGESLSSGERQLVALARAFLAEPRVLVLDEATSNLDLASETRIEHALDVLVEGRTTILIAHRLSTAMRADRIVVVDGGGIVEEGSHGDLIAAAGAYAQMYARWLSHLEPAS